VLVIYALELPKSPDWSQYFYVVSQQKLFNLVKKQNDGTVEVDLEKDAPLASEFLKFQSFEESTMSGTIIYE